MGFLESIGDRVGFGHRGSTRDAMGDKRAKAGARVQYRAMVIADIAAFLTTHDLELSAANFELARDVVTGADPKLAAAVGSLLSSGASLTDAVAREIVARTTPGRLTPELLSEMLAAVEIQANALLGIAEGSHQSMRDYGDALGAEISATEADDESGLVARLVSLTLGMVERAREIEEEMRESRKQARRLSKNLDRARHAADHDELTGLPNRRAFERRFAAAVEHARNSGEPLSLAICDIDRFKAINDAHGHATGDRVLCYVAGQLARLAPDDCHVARHGGEEFVMLFPGREAEAALALVDTVRGDVAARRLVSKSTGERIDSVTFSAGVAQVDTNGDVRAALEAADKALYAAKDGGRNRVEIAGSDALSAGPLPESPHD